MVIARCARRATRVRSRAFTGSFGLLANRIISTRTEENAGRFRVWSGERKVGDAFNSRTRLSVRKTAVAHGLLKGCESDERRHESLEEISGSAPLNGCGEIINEMPPAGESEWEPGVGI